MTVMKLNYDQRAFQCIILFPLLYTKNYLLTFYEIFTMFCLFFAWTCACARKNKLQVIPLCVALVLFLFEAMVLPILTRKGFSNGIVGAAWKRVPLLASNKVPKESGKLPVGN